MMSRLKPVLQQIRQFPDTTPGAKGIQAQSSLLRPIRRPINAMITDATFLLDSSCPSVPWDA